MSVCVVCCKGVRRRQQGLECDECSRWTHRVCNTGISLDWYRAAVREKRDIEFVCRDCTSAPPTEEPVEDAAAAEEDEPPVLEPSVYRHATVLDEPPSMTEEPVEDAAAPEEDEPPRLEPSVYLHATVFDEPPSMMDSVNDEPPVLEPSVYLHATVFDEPPLLEPSVYLEPSLIDTSIQEEDSDMPSDFPDPSTSMSFAAGIRDRDYRSSTIYVHNGPAVTVTSFMDYEDRLVEEDDMYHTFESIADDATDDPEDSAALLASFDLSHRDADDPEEPVESSFHPESVLSDTVLPDQPVTFLIHEKGSKRGGRLLVSTYGVKLNNKSSTLWTCNVRSKVMRCHATVRQVGDSFASGHRSHCHPGDIKLPVRVEAATTSKRMAKDQLFRAATDIIEEVELNHIPAELRFLKQKKNLLKRAVNRYRANMRPVNPTDLDFELDSDFIKAEEFLVADINVDGQRHFLFSTPFQMRLLQSAKRWFIDGTFKIVHDPFQQLLSVHAFVQIDGTAKQFPLAYVLMSRRQKTDYVEVFRVLKDKLQTPAVENFVLDFEKAAWQALRDVFLGITIKGCIFHWTQAVWRHVQELGLATTYRERKSTHQFISQLLALPFLPASHIRDTFQSLKARVNTEPLRRLTNYIERQWIESIVFPPSSWTAFRHTIRTNNDVEGWHYRMNFRAGQPGLGFYRLVPLLRREAELVNVDVTAEDLHRDVRSARSKMEDRLQSAWDRYMEKEISTGHFLRLCSNLYRPNVTVRQAGEAEIDIEG